MSVCERKDFLSNYCYIIIIVVVVWGYPSLVGFSCGLRLSGETHLRRVCDTADRVSCHLIIRAEKMTLMDDISVIHQDDSSDEPQLFPTLQHSIIAGLHTRIGHH